VLPVVVEVIIVQKPLAEAEAKIPQPDPFWIIGKADASLVGDAIFFAVDEKPMEMAIRPPHGQLKDVMKICDGGLSVDKESTPNQGADATQGNLELVNNSMWWVKHERSLSELLSSHLPRFLADSVLPRLLDRRAD